MESKNDSLDFLFASLLCSYPDDHFIVSLRQFIVNDIISLDAPLRAATEKLISDNDALSALQSEYIDLFDKGANSVPLYETEYGRHRAMVKGHELADLSAFYKAFGLELGSDDKIKEMLDHISIELEFYGLLLLKEEALVEKNDAEGIFVVQEARRKFLKDHLGRFANEIAKNPKVATSSYYLSALTWCGELVASECRALDVEAIPASWLPMESEGDSMCCGILGGQSI
jgi:TorA maturation chaperone TorD